jgi:hypothetical protein
VTARTRGAASSALLAATAALFLVSLGKWSDPIVDTGSEWMYADALARGEMLYRDVIYWFGPFTPYFQALFLKLFGSSFVSLAISGIVGSLGTLAALHWAVRRVGGRRQAFLWTALAVPVLVFMPNAGGSILGMGYRSWHPATFSLLAVTAAARCDRRTWMAKALLVGTMCALAGLSRTEWGLMALAASILTFGLARGAASRRLRCAAVAAAAAFVGFFAVVGLFVALAGKQAVLSDGSLFLTGVSPETRRFLVAFSRVREWPSGLAELAYSAAVWSAAVLLALAYALRRRKPRRVWAGLAATALVAAIAALAGGVRGAVLFSAAPLVSLAGLLAGFLRRGRPGAAALGGLGLMGLLAAHRRPFHIGDTPYVAPQLLFAFACAAGLLHLLCASRRAADERRSLVRAGAVALSFLVAAAFAFRIRQYAEMETVWIPGTGRMLSAGAPVAAEIAATASAVRAAEPEASSLVVFPEGQVLNFLSRKPNPLRQKLYIPGYLRAANEPELLADLQRTRPGAIVVWPRSTEEYGPAAFGVDYGREVFAWIERNYERSAGPVRGRARLYIPRREVATLKP